MVRREDYLYRTLHPARVAFCDYYAQKRQDDAVEARRQAGRGAPEDPVEALHINKIGLYAEAINMLHLSPVKVWHFYKKGSLHHLPDFEDWIDSKCNQRKYPINYLIIDEDDDPTWAYILTYPMPDTNLLTYCSAGWCFGRAAQARQDYFRSLNPRRPPAFNVPHDSPILMPMKQLMILHQLRLEFGDEDGQRRWLKNAPPECIANV
jgi:hypothetical protein